MCYNYPSTLANTAPVAQSEAVTLTLKLINTGDFDIESVTVRYEEATMPDWVVAQDIVAVVNIRVSIPADVLVPFHFTIDKAAPVGHGEPIQLQIVDSERSVWHTRFVLNVEPRVKPKVFRLLQNYPNPFNPETWIPYEM